METKSYSALRAAAQVMSRSDLANVAEPSCPSVERTYFHQAGTRNLALLELQLARSLVLFEKFPQLFTCFQKTNPLFVIQSDRETAKAIHAHASLFANFEFQLAGTTPRALLFHFG